MQLVEVSVENEMDLTLAYKKSIKAAELLGLSISTQTAFATAVSEVCREVIDKTREGLASIQIQNEAERFQLAAVITYKVSKDFGSLEEGFEYARKLVPVFHSSVKDSCGKVELKLSIPRSCSINIAKLNIVKNYFKHVEPTTPYEEVRQRNLKLFQSNEQSELALRHAQYLIQQKNEFLSIASHELKTPLTILKAFTQLALRGDCSSQTREHLIKVDGQALKIQTLIKQLLDISKIENGQADYNMEYLDFNEYLENIADLMRQFIPEHKLEIKLDKSHTVYMDKIRIEQVITNIIGNAAKYSAIGTSIKLCTKILPDGNLVFSVCDEGISMPPDELLKVFEKFYRVEEVTKKYNGLGMGLYICSKIIKDHGGKIWVENNADTGSTFFFSLPINLN